MRRSVCVMFLVLATTTVAAEELTVGMIMSAKRAGADANGLIKMIGDPAYTVVKVSPAELETLRAAGVAPEVIAAIQARMPVPTPAPMRPDDPRLTDVVRLVRSGLSEAIVVKQVETSKQVFDLTVNDLVYLKESGVPDPVIQALLATKSRPVAPVAAPAAGGVVAAPAPAPTVVAPVPVPAAAAAPVVSMPDVVLDDLVLTQPAFLKKSRPGRISLKGDEFSWTDGVDAKESFHFKLATVERVWLTCQASGTDKTCYQINIQITKGARYCFQDLKREPGSNESVHKLEEQVRARFPNVPLGNPELN
jgi:hypothetical protein